MTSKTTVDAARVELLLNELRLPGVKLMWAKLAEQSDKEGWPAARFLAAIAEHEMVDRGRRRMERHLTEARLPAGKTLATFDFESVPMVSKAQVMALAAGDRDAFVAAELAEREAAFLPPYGRLAAIILSSENAVAVEKLARELAGSIPNAERLEVYGPADAPLALVRGRRRKRLLVRADRDVDLQGFLRAWLARVKVPGSVRLTVDVDPYNFL